MGGDDCAKMRRNGGGRGMEREGLDCGNLRENAQERWWTGDGKGKRDNKGTQAGDYGTWQIKKKASLMGRGS